MTANKTKDKGLDELFDEGADMTPYIVEEATHFPALDGDRSGKAINVVMPSWLVAVLDDEAERRGVTRKAIINTVLVEWADGRHLAS